VVAVAGAARAAPPSAAKSPSVVVSSSSVIILAERAAVRGRVRRQARAGRPRGGVKLPPSAQPE
jgi:hypothetical protein